MEVRVARLALGAGEGLVKETRRRPRDVGIAGAVDQPIEPAFGAADAPRVLQHPVAVAVVLTVDLLRPRQHA